MLCELEWGLLPWLGSKRAQVADEVLRVLMEVAFTNPHLSDSCLLRSLMNVAFTIPHNADLEKSFVSQAAKEGMVQLKGHRCACLPGLHRSCRGGLRVSSTLNPKYWINGWMLLGCVLYAC